MIGCKLLKIEASEQGDEGLKLTFEGGHTLEFMYTGGEGKTFVDDNELVGQVDFEELCAS